ncbi:MAG: DUF2125 domain-containing protein [Caulobacterales bacterium]|nr:DUF2125 domain-containing protein [Caulobacterales bacterium]
MTLPDRSTARKPRRLGLVLPWLALLLLAVGWSIAWVRLRTEAVTRMDAAAEQLRAQGYPVEWKTRTVTGYPFRLDITLTDARIGEPSGWAMALPTLKSEAWIYRLDHWMLVAPDGVTLTRPDGGPVAVRARALRASLAGLGSRPPRLSIEGADVDFDTPPGAKPYLIRSAERLELHLRPGPDDQGGVLFKVEGAKLRLQGLPARVAQDRPVSMQWELVLSKMSGFSGRSWPSAVRNWRDAGGVITVRGAELRGGDALLTGTGGPLRVGSDGRLEGQINATLKESGGRGQGFGGPVDLEDGRARLGPLDLGPAPRVY